LQKDVHVCVVGKVFKPNKRKVLALNKTLDEYFRLVMWYLSFNSTSKTFLHENCYEKAKELFNLNTALIQTARDKAVEILKSFEKKQKRGQRSKAQKDIHTLRQEMLQVLQDDECPNPLLAYAELEQERKSEPTDSLRREAETED